MTTEFKEEAKEMFEKLYTLNVNQYTEKKNGLTYLSWSYAWAEFKKVYPDATYEIKKFENNMPFVKKYDSYSCKNCEYLKSCKPWLEV